MKIGNLDLGYQPLLLAPMEDVSTPPFRLLCKQYGADLMYTEFVSSEALIRLVNRTMKKMTIVEEERPLAIQIYGKEVNAMTEAAKIAEQANPDFIDINFGCPVKKVATKGSGAGMLLNIPLMMEITEAVVKAVNVPVTVKTRLGWDEDSKIIVNLAEQLQDTGIQALTIHGRTRCQMYTGEADWDLIGKVKNNPRMNIPIIGNGDITNPIKAKEAFDKYGVDAIMIGRGAIGKPWIFRDIKHYLKTGELLPPATVSQQVEMLKQQINGAIDWIDEKRGILHMRRHMAGMFKGLTHFKQTRIQMLRSGNYEELMLILDSISDQWGDSISED
ncbi:tRNA dihydrouridine synthase DusB [Ancylomarina euxinus]|uniref:tRNA-dihydrouridine synthase n=1 Tax=Ancylomarina euxinus TaxID=2283627 RepID=A0A425Y8J8_9BACT|nr:tRNA dihydrouridine synthase DusB [Ancylomarina euxinus]MCZ4693470.1 tRNA dihydrouridine synthase DusB [Ancylomarina euxinus]MUP13697.1 tRNA dihydrouridine synthase DusB [Ancylomarina euxinus]RRG24662.1 tRNA dihydrouridine synthase DusB [Ancylomarina euxinus]